MKTRTILPILVLAVLAWLPGSALADTFPRVSCPSSASTTASSQPSLAAPDYTKTAFGETFKTTASIQQRYTFAGRETSANAGAPMFYRNRMYSPMLGRFGRRDPKLGGDSLYNAYGFPKADEVNASDPMGLWTLSIPRRAVTAEKKDTVWGLADQLMSKGWRWKELGIPQDIKAGSEYSLDTWLKQEKCCLYPRCSASDPYTQELKSISRVILEKKWDKELETWNAVCSRKQKYSAVLVDCPKAPKGPHTAYMRGEGVIESEVTVNIPITERVTTKAGQTFLDALNGFQTHEISLGGAFLQTLLDKEFDKAQDKLKATVLIKVAQMTCAEKPSDDINRVWKDEYRLKVAAMAAAQVAMDIYIDQMTSDEK